MATTPLARRPDSVVWCREALDILERALLLSPPQLKRQVDEAERCVVRARDDLIDLLRGAAADRLKTRDALDRVNVALSLIVGVEYPATGIQRSMLEEARDVLTAVLADGARR